MFSRKRWGLFASAALALTGAAWPGGLRAQTVVTSAAQLQTDINNGLTNFVLGANITVSAPIYIGTTSSPTITISGLDGGKQYSVSDASGVTSELFFVQSGTVTFSHTTLSGNALGGYGATGQFGGGGAAGLGGAIFVGSTANVTVSSVKFSNNSASGANGGGDGGSGFPGGGGLNSGLGGAGPFGGGGGGGGNGGDGGAGEIGNGGGGGGLQSVGGSSGATTGGTGGGPSGGTGGTSGNGGSATGPNSGGGGASNVNGGTGGNGSTNGGGGGGAGNTGGNGGEYAGGGGAQGLGGNGGFGGGGGAGYTQGGGNGGFGGGGGAALGAGGTGGVGGGTGQSGTGSGLNSGVGGGGAGLGGAIFVQAGGSLTITGSGAYTGGSVTGGPGYNAGAAAGSDLFLMTGVTTVMAPGTGNKLTFNGTIADDSAASLPSGGSYTPGTAAGAAITIGSGSSAGGTVVFNGVNTYSGGTTLTNGATLVAGNSSALGGGSVTVESGTLIMGSGNHTLTIGGYTQTGGALELSVAGHGQTATADQLQVTNTNSSQVSLGGTLTLNLASYRASFGTSTFTLIDTAAGFTNEFSSIDPIGLGRGETLNVDYDTTDGEVLLQITQANLAFSMAGLTPNQQSILGAINNAVASGNNSHGFTKFIDALNRNSSNPSALGGALDQLSPQGFGQFASATAFNNASFETEEMDSYLDGRRGGPGGTFLGGNGSLDTSGLTVNDPSYDPSLEMVHSRLMAFQAAPDSHGLLSDSADSVLGGVTMRDPKDMKEMMPPAQIDPWNFYVRGNVILAQGFSGQDTSHFDDNTESVEGGVDYRLTPNVLVGLTAGYAHTDVTLDDNGSSATVDSYSPGFYASYADKGWYANLTGSYVHNAYTQSRVIGFLGQEANSAPEGNEGVANLDGGYDFHQGALTFGPLAGLQYTHLSVDGYGETGSLADLSVNEQDADSLRSRLGGRLSYALVHQGITFTPHLDASWQHEFMDQSRGITSQFSDFGGGAFSVRTLNPSRESVLLDAGLDAQLNRTVNLFLDYQVQAGQANYFGQAVNAGVKIGF